MSAKAERVAVRAGARAPRTKPIDESRTSSTISFAKPHIPSQQKAAATYRATNAAGKREPLGRSCANDQNDYGVCRAGSRYSRCANQCASARRSPARASGGALAGGGPEPAVVRRFACGIEPASQARRACRRSKFSAHPLVRFDVAAIVPASANEPHRVTRWRISSYTLGASDATISPADLPPVLPRAAPAIAQSG